MRPTVADGPGRPTGDPRIGHGHTALLAAGLNDIVNRNYPNRLAWPRDVELCRRDPWIA
jgi:hypothetical protein